MIANMEQYNRDMLARAHQCQLEEPDELPEPVQPDEEPSHEQYEDYLVRTGRMDD